MYVSPLLCTFLFILFLFSILFVTIALHSYLSCSSPSLPFLASYVLHQVGDIQQSVQTNFLVVPSPNETTSTNYIYAVDNRGCPPQNFTSYVYTYQGMSTLVFFSSFFLSFIFLTSVLSSLYPFASFISALFQLSMRHSPSR